MKQRKFDSDKVYTVLSGKKPVLKSYDRNALEIEKIPPSKTKDSDLLPLLADKLTKSGLLQRAKITFREKTKNPVEFALRSANYLPTVLCDKCDHRDKCPFYIRDGVCEFVTTVYPTPRQRALFFHNAYELLQKHVWSSSLMTNHQTEYDLMYFMTLVLVLKIAQEDQFLEVSRIHRLSGAKNAEVCGRLSIAEVKKRAKILGIPFSSLGARAGVYATAKVIKSKIFS